MSHFTKEDQVEVMSHLRTFFSLSPNYAEAVKESYVLLRFTEEREGIAVNCAFVDTDKDLIPEAGDLSEDDLGALSRIPVPTLCAMRLSKELGDDGRVENIIEESIELHNETKVAHVLSGIRERLSADECTVEEARSEIKKAFDLMKKSRRSESKEDGDVPCDAALEA